MTYPHNQNSPSLPSDSVASHTEDQKENTFNQDQADEPVEDIIADTIQKLGHDDNYFHEPRTPLAVTVQNKFDDRFVANNDTEAEVEENEKQKLAQSRAKRYDWDLAVSLLINGCTMDEVAERLGCTRRAVFAAIRRSPGLRDRIKNERILLQAEACARLDGVRNEVARQVINLAFNGDNSALMFLARQLKLGQHHYDSLSPESLTSLPPKGGEVREVKAKNPI